MCLKDSHLIATLGSEPQVITATLDLLISGGASITHVTVLHTASNERKMRSALQCLAQEITSDQYSGLGSCQFQLLVDPGGRSLNDVDTISGVQDFFRLIYQSVWSAKQAGQQVHLSISGGRKTMAIYGMAAAQMLFDEDDHLWYLLSGGEFLASKRLHPGDGDDAHLISIPVLLWTDVSPAVAALSQINNPFEALDQVRQLRLQEKMETARIFVDIHLSSAERKVVRELVLEGMSDKEIAEMLYLSPRTVEQHLRSAYRKAADYWQMETVTRTQLIALLQLYFSMQNRGNPA